MSDPIKFDPNEWTLGDMDDFETVVGKPLSEVFKAKNVIGDDGQPEKDKRGRPVKEVTLDAKSIIAIVWLEKRRTNPEFTLEDARKVKFTALEMAGDEDPEA